MRSNFAFELTRFSATALHGAAQRERLDVAIAAFRHSQAERILPLISFSILRTLKLLTLVSVLVMLALTAASPAIAQVRDVTFGILRVLSDGEYELDIETTRIPRRFKDSGFRFGVAFSNPTGKTIEWYEVVHLPADLEQLTGGLRQVRPKLLQTDKQQSNQKRVVDHFWFDKGDPLGPHRLELYVNGVRQFSVDFQVIEAGR